MPCESQVWPRPQVKFLHGRVSSNRDIIGLIPAAGHARRLPSLPCSKEIYPVDIVHKYAPGGKKLETRVAAHNLLHHMREGDAKCAHIILRDGKWDIPAFLLSGKSVGLPLSYLIMEEPHGVPFTLDQAYWFVKDALVIMGFPDILFQPDDAYRRLLDRQLETQADLVLGLFPARTPGKVDMVRVEEDGQINSISIKPEETSLHYTWLIAAWEPSFTEYLHQFTHRLLRKRTAPDGLSGREVHMGHLIQQAADDGVSINSVLFEKGKYVDIGTVDELTETVKNSRIHWSS